MKRYKDCLQPETNEGKLDCLLRSGLALHPVHSSEMLDSLAERLERRAREIDSARAWYSEDRIVRHGMVLIYKEIAEMLRAEREKLSNVKISDGKEPPQTIV